MDGERGEAGVPAEPEPLHPVHSGYGREAEKRRMGGVKLGGGKGIRVGIRRRCGGVGGGRGGDEGADREIGEICGWERTAGQCGKNEGHEV